MSGQNHFDRIFIQKLIQNISLELYQFDRMLWSSNSVCYNRHNDSINIVQSDGQIEVDVKQLQQQFMKHDPLDLHNFFKVVAQQIVTGKYEFNHKSQ
jgi:hypothetical protein